MKRFLAGFAAILMMIACCGCAANEPEEIPSTTTTTTTQTTTTTKAPVKDYNFLTGETNLVKGATTRPVAVMINNLGKVRPQRGIDKADLYVEAETEGGITRIMAVFASQETLPDELGPIRSARTHFVRIADALDTIYVHAGGSPKAKALIKSTNLAEIDFCGADGGAFWRDSELRKKNGLEHSLLSNRKKISSRIEKRGYRTNYSAKAPFSFGEVAGSKAASKVQIKVSASQNVRFEYDAAKGVYLKYAGKKNLTPHNSYKGGQLSAANVVVMFAKRFKEDASHVTFELDNGTALLASGGTAREIKWSRTDSQLSFTEADGSSAKFATGKTYICLVHSGYKDDTVCS